MRWKGRRSSENVEDRRGMSAPAIGGGLGLGGIVLYLLFTMLGGNPADLEGQLGAATGKSVRAADLDPEAKGFVSVVLADTEEVWGKLFRDEIGQKYDPPKLVLFTDKVESACGYASAAAGPFYCSEDSKVYIDLSFYELLKERFGAPGDFAQAYVIAHEVGHHVQNLLGISDHVHKQRSQLSQSEYNKLSVRLELQADFFAGIWSHYAKEMAGVTKADICEAVQAANAIGDDTLQKNSQGYVVPDSFTHGTSEQRIKWFLKGLDTGDLNKGDTFRSPNL